MFENIDAEKDGRIFKNIEALIVEVGKLILKNIDEDGLNKSAQNEFNVTVIDNYDFYDVDEKYCLRKNVIEPNSTDELIYHRECITTYRRAFKFLQLMC